MKSLHSAVFPSMQSSSVPFFLSRWDRLGQWLWTRFRKNSKWGQMLMWQVPPGNCLPIGTLPQAPCNHGVSRQRHAFWNTVLEATSNHEVTRQHRWLTWTKYTNYVLVMVLGQLWELVSTVPPVSSVESYQWLGAALHTNACIV